MEDENRDDVKVVNLIDETDNSNDLSELLDDIDNMVSADTQEQPIEAPKKKPKTKKAKNNRSEYSRYLTAEEHNQIDEAIKAMEKVYLENVYLRKRKQESDKFIASQIELLEILVNNFPNVSVFEEHLKDAEQLRANRQ